MNRIKVVWRWFQPATHEPIALTTILLPILLFLLIRRMSDKDTCSLEYFKSLYRQRRNAFRANVAANEELRQWKARNDDFEYVEL